MFALPISPEAQKVRPMTDECMWTSSNSWKPGEGGPNPRDHRLETDDRPEMTDRQIGDTRPTGRQATRSPPVSFGRKRAEAKDPLRRPGAQYFGPRERVSVDVKHACSSKRQLLLMLLHQLVHKPQKARGWMLEAETSVFVTQFHHFSGEEPCRNRTSWRIPARRGG